MIDASKCFLSLSGTWSDIPAWEAFVLEAGSYGAGTWVHHLARHDGSEGTSKVLELGVQPHGQMPNALEDALHALGLGYLWSWESAHLYDGGFELWRPGDEGSRTATIGQEGDFLLRLEEAQNPDLVAQAVALNTDRLAFIAHKKLLFVGSAHDQLRAGTMRFW